MTTRSWIRNLFARSPWGTLATCPSRTAQARWKRAPQTRRRTTVHLYLQPCEDRILPAPALLTSYDGINEADSKSWDGMDHPHPDANAAIGTTHTVAVVSNVIEIGSKGHAGYNRAALYSFFGVSSSANLYDSKVLWDRQSQRFFVMTLDRDNTSRSMIHLAVSPTGDPSTFGSWQKFSFDATEIVNLNTYADYAGFGSDSAALYITASKFQFYRGHQIEGNRLWIVNKDNLIHGTLTQNRYVLPNTWFLTQPAQMYQDLPTGPGIFLTTWDVPPQEGASWQLDLVRVDHPLSNPTYTFSTLSAGYISDGYILPSAPQPRSSATINTGDQRRLSAVWSHGQLYVANTVNPPDGPDAGRATVHWFRIDTTDLSNVRLADQGNIDGAGVITNMYTYYPSVTVDDAGNMAVGFSGSNAPDTPVGAFYTTRLAGDPPGYTERIAFLRGGDDWWDHNDSGGVADWGRLSGAGLDPDGRTFLFFNEYAGTRDIINWPYGRWVTHYGTTAYANHYRLVTAGGVTTLTTDNSVTSVLLNRSGSSTQISVNGTNIGSTTAATITVNAGFARTTALTVINLANGTFTLTGSQLVSPGLTVNLSNLGNVELDGGTGTYTVVNTPAGPGHTTTVKTGTGTTNTVKVQATSGALTVNTFNSAYSDVALGNANSVAGITGAVTIDSGGEFYQAEVNDGADNANHPNVLLTSAGSTASLTGLAPAAINFLATGFLNPLSITFGNGNNTYTVAGTPGGFGALNTGTGTDTVNVQATSRPLTVNAQGGGGNDVVNLGNANNLAGIAGAVTINSSARTRVNVNDGADNAIHSGVVLSATSLTGLAPAPINFGPASVNTLTVSVGNGANTYTISGTPGNVGNTLNTGSGADTVNVQATSSPLTVNAAGNSTVVNLGNAGTLAGITAAVALNPNHMFTVNINDGSDNANHPAVAIGATGVTGLAPAPLNVDIVTAGTLNLSVGNGADAYRISETPRNALNLHTGTGTNTVTVTPTSSRGPITLTGNPAGFNTLVATNGPTWHITGADAGNFSAGTLLSFTGYGSLTGGSGSNTFVFSDGASLDGTLDGGSSGSNTLDSSAYSTAESFALTGSDAGTGTPVAAFVNIQNLVGAGAGGSYFQFADGATLDGSLTGGGSDTLDYSLYTTSVVVDLQPSVASATGVGGSISGFTTVIGASGAPGTAGLYNLLIGSDVGGDILQGGTGRRNILVAGGGASTLIGGDGEDLLIGGTTKYDTDLTLTNWLAIADYWAGTDDFATRSANLQSGNGVPLLDASTVTGNGGGNTMQGNGGIALIYTDGQDAIDNGFADMSLVNIAP